MQRCVIVQVNPSTTFRVLWIQIYGSLIFIYIDIDIDYYYYNINATVGSSTVIRYVE